MDLDLIGTGLTVDQNRMRRVQRAQLPNAHLEDQVGVVRQHSFSFDANSVARIASQRSHSPFQNNTLGIGDIQSRQQVAHFILSAAVWRLTT